MGEMAKNQLPYSNPLADDARRTLSHELETQAQRSAGKLGEVATALRRTSQELDRNAAAPLIEKAADQIDRVSEMVRTADVDDVRARVESFARREPLVFLGGAFALGMIGARFLKSSSNRGGGT